MLSSRGLGLQCLLLSALPLVLLINAFTTLQYDVTTMVANGTGNDTDCFCDCEELDVAANKSDKAPATQDEAEEAANQLRVALQMDKANLSSTTRKKISIPDSRPSAQGIGAVGVIVIVTVLGSIVVLDLTVLIQHSKHAMARILGWEIDETDMSYRRGRHMRHLRGGLRARNIHGRRGSCVATSNVYQLKDNKAYRTQKFAGHQDMLARGDERNVAGDESSFQNRDSSVHGGRSDVGPGNFSYRDGVSAPQIRTHQTRNVRDE